DVSGRSDTVRRAALARIWCFKRPLLLTVARFSSAMLEHHSSRARRVVAELEGDREEHELVQQSGDRQCRPIQRGKYAERRDSEECESRKPDRQPERQAGEEEGKCQPIHRAVPPAPLHTLAAFASGWLFASSATAAARPIVSPSQI